MELLAIVVEAVVVVVALLVVVVSLKIVEVVDDTAAEGAMPGGLEYPQGKDAPSRP